MSCPSRKSANMRYGVLLILLSLAAPAVAQKLSADMAAQETGQQATAQQKQPTFGGEYSSLDARRQKLVDNWVKRFNEVTGQNVEAGPFYNTYIKFSAKTTFDAVTNALMTTALTTKSGQKLGDALDLVQEVDSVRGMVQDASGDQQFRIYVLLKEGAIKTLDQSKQFERKGDNSVYHKGYPINYRQEGGAPSIQISIALDQRHADIDVDYRSSGFPKALVNGHLSAANSDVRAGNNYDRHTKRWSGFENWWRSFFGVSLNDKSLDETDLRPVAIPEKPRIGEKDVDVMMNDFLKAWLVEGDVLGAISYVSPHAYACLAEDASDPSTFDRGMAPFILLKRLKAAHDALGTHQSLEGLAVPYSLTNPNLKLVKQPYPEFVLYSVPDDIAAKFNCESQLTPGDPKKAKREYGNYFGATLYISGTKKKQPLMLLWAKEKDYWKIVSWKTEEAEKEIQAVPKLPETQVVHIKEDPGFAAAAQSFLESWLIRKDYNAAFSFLSPKTYSCYDLLRDPDQPAAASMEDAGKKIRAGLERVGNEIGKKDNLNEVISATPPFHPSFHVMDHPQSDVFTLSSVPNIVIDVADCAARAARGGERYSGDVPPEYGKAFVLSFRFKTLDGEAPVLRTLWTQDNGNWRIIAYDIELP